MILGFDADVVISGHSPVGGIDIWAEEIADELGVVMQTYEPIIQQWNPPGGYGYKARNLDIANNSDLVAVIVAREYPENYYGRRFALCYHCRLDDHVKSGGCWTGKKARAANWYYIDNNEGVVYVGNDAPEPERSTRESNVRDSGVDV